MIETEGRQPIRDPAFLQAADGVQESIAIIALRFPVEIICLIFESGEDEKQAQGVEKIVDHVAGAEDLKDLSSHITENKTEDGDDLIPGKLFSGMDKHQGCPEDASVGGDIQQGMENSPAVSRLLIEKGDEMGGRRGDDKGSVQNHDRNKEDEHRLPETGDPCEAVGIEKENTRQEIIQPEIGQVDGEAHERRI